jgi:trimethylamine corrinoid protein
MKLKASAYLKQRTARYNTGKNISGNRTSGEKERTVASEQMSSSFEAIKNAVTNYDEDLVKKLVKEAIDQGFDPLRILNEALTPAIREIGDRFGRSEIFLTELLIAANVCMVGVEIAKKRLLEERRSASKPKGIVVLGTVQGDVHNIGKDILKTLLETSGYQVFDLGIDVPADEFAKKALLEKADFVGSSALLTTTRPEQKVIEKKLRDAGIRSKVHTIVGGGATDQDWAREIGADYYAADAVEGVQVIRRAMEKHV